MSAQSEYFLAEAILSKSNQTSQRPYLPLMSLSLMTSEKVDISSIFSNLHKLKHTQDSIKYDYENRIQFIQIPSSTPSMATRSLDPSPKVTSRLPSRRTAHQNTSSKTLDRPPTKYSLSRSASEGKFFIEKTKTPSLLKPKKVDVGVNGSKAKNYFLQVHVDSDYQLSNPPTERVLDINTSRTATIQDMRNTPIRNFLNSIGNYAESPNARQKQQKKNKVLKSSPNATPFVKRNSARLDDYFKNRESVLAGLKVKRPIQFGKTFYMGSEKKHKNANKDSSISQERLKRDYQ